MSDVVEIVRVVEAVERIPKPRRKGVTYFSEQDVWQYQAVADTRVCPDCRRHEETNWFQGDRIRGTFDYLVIMDVNTIEARVHPNCRCYLLRVIEPTAYPDFIRRRLGIS